MEYYQENEILERKEALQKKEKYLMDDKEEQFRKEYRLIEKREEIFNKELVSKCLDHSLSFSKQLTSIKQDILRGVYSKESALDILSDLKLQCAIIMAEAETLNSKQGNAISENIHEQFDKFQATLNSNNNINK